MSGLRLLWKRACLLEMRRMAAMCYVVLFFIVLSALLPLGLPVGEFPLSLLAPGVVWACALLATILTLPQWFGDDIHDDTLAQYLLIERDLLAWVCVKWLIRWLCLGCPLAIATLFVSVLWHLNGVVTITVVTSLLIGTVPLTGLAALIAALTVRADQQTILWPILFLPMTVPLYILGSSSAALVLAHHSPLSPLLLLTAIAIVTIVSLPWVVGGLLQYAIHY